MSGPSPLVNPPQGEEDYVLGRRASEGDLLASPENQARKPKQASASPSHPPPPPSQPTDELNSRMQNLQFEDQSQRIQQQRYPETPTAAGGGTEYPSNQSYQPFMAPPEFAYPQQSFQPFVQQHHSPYQYSSPGYYEPPPEFSLETMHGMPGSVYNIRPPVQRSAQTSPHNPSPPYPPNPQQMRPPQQYGVWSSPPMSPVMNPGQAYQMGQGQYGQMAPRHSRQDAYVDEYGNVQPIYYNTTPPQAWTPQSASQPYFYQTYQQQQVQIPMDQHQRQGGSDWSSPSMASAPQFMTARGSWTGPQQARPPLQQQQQQMRASWSGPSRPPPESHHPPSHLHEKEIERRNYHPQPPARRSDWVMWVGNVPSTTSHEELWHYFNTTVPTPLPAESEEEDTEPWRGPSSIFLISKSSCAFVNLSSQKDLDRAVAFFNGRSLRPRDPNCPPMVCRVRRKDDDLRSGVGAQRGTGMHRTWIKDQEKKTKDKDTDAKEELEKLDTAAISSPIPVIEPTSPAIFEHPPEGEGRRRDSILQGADVNRHKSSASYASTNSSFLAKHFPMRLFILKSLTTIELENSVQSGTWRTQSHNEPILDQAFRTSQEVFLVFSANRSGEFFGYAKMVEPIDKERAAAAAAASVSRSVSGSSKVAPGSQGSSSGSGSGGSGSGTNRGKAVSQPMPEKITEEEEDRSRASSDPPPRPGTLVLPGQGKIASSSPQALTPVDEPGEEEMLPTPTPGERKTDPDFLLVKDRLPDRANVSAPAVAGARRPPAIDPIALQAIRANQHLPPVPIASMSSNEATVGTQDALGGSDRPATKDTDGVLRKDTVLSPKEKSKRQAEAAAAAAAEHEVPEDGWGRPFKIQWVKVSKLSFGRIHQIRNPWNHDREVKVSRDGTEVEPGVGAKLLAEWDKLA